jgi:hypothetical protein
MRGEIVVYWANRAFNYEAPEPDYAVKDLHERVSKISELDPSNTKSIIKCPVVSQYLKNTFSVKSPIDYSLQWSEQNEQITTEHGDQEFFDKNIFVRDYKSGIVSFKFGAYFFFTEEDSLVAEYKSACYANNALVNNSTFIQGEIDIGRYFRSTDYTCFLNRSDELLNVKRGDSLYYVRFLTDKKIKFKKFHMSSDIKELVTPVMQSVSRTRNRLHNISVWNKIEQYYDLFKTSQIKKQLIKNIKANILD